MSDLKLVETFETLFFFYNTSQFPAAYLDAMDALRLAHPHLNTKFNLVTRQSNIN